MESCLEAPTNIGGEDLSRRECANGELSGSQPLLSWGGDHMAESLLVIRVPRGQQPPQVCEGVDECLWERKVPVGVGPLNLSIL